MAATTLPRAVRNSVRVITLAMWVTVPVAAVAWDVRSLVVALGLAAVGTGAQGFLYLADKIDVLATRQRERFHERQLALIGVIEQMSCGPVTGPQEKLEPSALRVVS